ncbi:Kinetochore protein Nuf2 [Microtus ochrogaster]|uniref:Kinetochore protein Nuf2 n=1 Tax=Microtus ochrogaster TaxID=79684 RepID=A0A8J6GIX9_MICOH|nr:Kinetochore protein Nuf2 [Microtus ochrogaster]
MGTGSRKEYSQMPRQCTSSRACFLRQTGLQEGHAQKKSDISEKTKRLNELKLSMVSLKEAQESLKSKIADSPKKVEICKEKMKGTVQKLRNARQEVMEKTEVYRDSVECLPSCQLEVQLYQKKIQDLADNREKLSSTLKENLNLEDQIESDSSELKKLKTEENSLKRLLIVKKEKLATTRFRINKKQEDMKQYKQTVIEYGPDAGLGLRTHKESREAFKVKNSASSDYDVIILSGFFRLFVWDCNKVQDKRGAVCEQVTTITLEIQKIKSGVQQLKDSTKREKLKSQEIFVNLKSALEKYHEGIEATTKEYCSRIEEKTAELKKRMFRVPPSSA